jgi:uncharacterized protein YdeI (YjbR/CyaY-like superfamily)
METYKGISTYYARDRRTWRNWLEKNHIREQSLWLTIFHKTSPRPSVYYDEAVEEALCFGWVDSKPNKRDHDSYYLFFAKRNPKSYWSRINKDRVSRLLKMGLMHPAGLEIIKVAKSNGAWTALDDIENLVIPEDLQMAFLDFPGSHTQFDKFPKSAKKGILEWIFSAKRQVTRKKRILETACLAQQGIRANQWSKKG